MAQLLCLLLTAIPDHKPPVVGHVPSTSVTFIFYEIGPMLALFGSGTHAVGALSGSTEGRLSLGTSVAGPSLFFGCVVRFSLTFKVLFMFASPPSGREHGPIVGPPSQACVAVTGMLTKKPCKLYERVGATDNERLRTVDFLSLPVALVFFCGGTRDRPFPPFFRLPRRKPTLKKL